MASVGISAEQTSARKAFFMASVVIVFGVLATTVAQTELLGRIPIRNLLKNVMHIDRTGTAAFVFAVTLPWYFKPLVGIVSDAFPLFGSRRRSYMIVGGTAAALAWYALGVTAHQYDRLLLGCMLINIAMVVTSTVVGGYMVEAAQATAGAGRLTSVRNVVEQFSYVITGPIGGFLGSVAFAWTTVACGSVAFLVVPMAIWFMREKAIPKPATAVLLSDAKQQLSHIARAKYMWAAAGIGALFYFAPGIQTAIFYKQQDVLHMGTQAQGFLTFLSGVFGVVAAALYGGYACRRLTLRTLLIVCLLAGVAGNLGYLFYSSVDAARVVESLNGFGYTLAEVAMMHLAVRATPSGSEALGFSLLVSARNFGLYGADWIGSYLLDHFHIGFNVLVWMNAGTSLLAVPAVLLLPAVLVNVRDAQKDG